MCMNGKLNIKSAGIGNLTATKISNNFEVYGLGAPKVKESTKIRGGIVQTGEF